MNDELRICPYCGDEFIPKKGNQKFCCIAHGRVFRGEWSKERLPQPSATFSNLQQKNKKRTLKQEVAEVQQYLYNIKNGNNVITQFKELAEKTINTMQIMKLDTYSDPVKEVCIDIMENLSLFLQNQLKTERDRGVIVVRAE